MHHQQLAMGKTVDPWYSCRMTPFFVIFLSGQVPKPETLRNSEVIDLIHDKTKYMLHVTKSGPNTYYVIMNESSLEVSI